jgi:hypothetical protein
LTYEDLVCPKVLVLALYPSSMADRCLCMSAVLCSDEYERLFGLLVEAMSCAGVRRDDMVLSLDEAIARSVMAS